MVSELEIVRRERMHCKNGRADALPTVLHRLRDAVGRDCAKSPVIAVDVGGTVEDTWSAKRSWFDLLSLEASVR